MKSVVCIESVRQFSVDVAPKNCTLYKHLAFLSASLRCFGMIVLQLRTRVEQYESGRLGQRQ